MSKCTVMKSAEPAMLEEVGRLIRSWVASGTVPTEQEAFDALSAIGIEFDGNVTKVRVVPYEEDTAIIALPPKASLDCIYDKIENDEKFRRDYSLGAPFIAIANSQGKDKPANVMRDFYDFRLGEYSLQHCE